MFLFVTVQVAMATVTHVENTLTLGALECTPTFKEFTKFIPS